MTTEIVRPYAACNDCGITLPTPEAAQAHAAETFKPAARTDGVLAESHGYRTLNPTPEERARWKVHGEVDDAIERCMERLDDLVRDGELTEAEVEDGLLGYPDFADAWVEWLQEENR